MNPTFSSFKSIGILAPCDLSGLQHVISKIENLRPHDLVIRIKSVSINPVDSKKRNGGSSSYPLILGYDASGIVESIGTEVKKFKVGDEVYYAGDITRNGTNALYHQVDERIVSLKPKNLSFRESAAVPLVTLTTWEALIENMKIEKNLELNKNKFILIIGGAGGVGSIAIQIAKKVLGLNVIATASREETIAYCKKLGADFTINHNKKLRDELNNINIKELDYVLNTSEMTIEYLNQIPELCKPCANVSYITGLQKPQNFELVQYFLKRISLHPEFMFSRSMFGFEMEKQGEILEEMRKLIEGNIIVGTGNDFKDFSLENLKEAHGKIEGGKTIGKIVLDGVDKYFETI